jgi:hypothetical protein
LKIPRISKFSIDWPNHIIGFFSALFGILIAFELDQWRERKQEIEIARNAFTKLKLEVEVNNNSLHEMVHTNQKLVELMIDKVVPFLNNELQFTGSKIEADSINYNSYLMTVTFIDTTQWAGKQRNPPTHIAFGNLLQPILHNSAWESAKATGALNFMDYEQVLSLSSLYSSPRITDETLLVKKLIQNADFITSKSQLVRLLQDLKKAHAIIDHELIQLDSFVNIIEQME